MTEHTSRERAHQPTDLAEFFVARANAGDVEGLVALYEPEAVLAFPPGHVAVGAQAIREVYTQLVAQKPVLVPGRKSPPLRAGNLALTSTLLPDGGATVEVARLQADGTWLWVIDQPNLLEAGAAQDNAGQRQG